MIYGLAGSTTHDARNPVFRVLQIIGHMRDYPLPPAPQPAFLPRAPVVVSLFFSGPFFSPEYSGRERQKGWASGPEASGPGERDEVG